MIEKYPVAMESYLEIIENDEEIMEAIVRYLQIYYNSYRN